MKKLLLMGANNPETLRIIEAINDVAATFEVVGWLDNDVQKHGSSVFGYPVLGPPPLLAEPEYWDCWVYNNITTNGRVRREVSRQLGQYTERFASIIHPSVNTRDVRIGAGVCIQEGALVQARAELDDHCFVTSASLVGHEAKIGSCSFIAGGCIIAGLTEVGEGSTIWTGSKLAPRLRIGDNATVGMNSAVLQDVPDHTTVFGSPAKKIFVSKK